MEVIIHTLMDMKKGDTYDKYREGIKYLFYDIVEISPNEKFTIKGGSKLEFIFLIVF